MLRKYQKSKPRTASGREVRELFAGECDDYLMRMSFLTDLTPEMWRVTSTALLIAAWELTKPLS